MRSMTRCSAYSRLPRRIAFIHTKRQTDWLSVDLLQHRRNHCRSRDQQFARRRSRRHQWLIYPAMAEKIPIAADHAGFDLKEKLKGELSRLGYQAHDLG